MFTRNTLMHAVFPAKFGKQHLSKVSMNFLKVRNPLYRQISPYRVHACKLFPTWNASWKHSPPPNCGGYLALSSIVGTIVQEKPSERRWNCAGLSTWWGSASASNQCCTGSTEYTRDTGSVVDFSKLTILICLVTLVQCCHDKRLGKPDSDKFKITNLQVQSDLELEFIISFARSIAL